MTRIRTLTVAALLASLALTGCSAAGPQASEISTPAATGEIVSGSAYSFNAPEGWSVPDNVPTQGVDALVVNESDIDGFSDNMNVIVSPAGEVSLDKAESAGLDELVAVGATNSKVHDRVIVDGSESAHISSDLSYKGLDYLIEQYSVTDAGQTYVVTFSFSPTESKPDRTELAESVLASWTWA